MLLGPDILLEAGRHNHYLEFWGSALCEPILLSSPIIVFIGMVLLVVLVVIVPPIDPST